MKKPVGQVFNALKNEKRIETLELLNEGNTIAEIADRLDMSYAGISAYVDDLDEADLVQVSNGSVEITILGQYILEEISEIEQQIERTTDERIVEEAKKEFEERGVGLSSPKGREILERLMEEAEEEGKE